MSETTSKTPKRHRGGQPGNQNARRFGIYSGSFSPAELENLDVNVEGEFLDEISIARIQVLRLAEIVKDYKHMPLDEYIAASNALCHYLDRIQRLSRAQHLIYQNQTTLEQALEELSKIPPEVD
jgi:hypothetical protein